ncbi:DUF6159 family protein [Halovenus marina]|uniref:DUF6159 family protein n=1 Tax=Halovenus marina TaxID=3396621 RepID=UPI003F56F30F
MQLLGRAKRGYLLVRQSVSVLREHPRLALFPVVSGIAGLAYLALLLTPMFSVLALDSSDTITFVVGGIALVGIYLGTAFISAFFTAALVHQTRAVLAGEEPSLRDGIENAWAVKWPLLAWAVISATVGVVLDLISESDSAVGQILAMVVGIAWTLLTFFVIPVIVFEKPSVREMFTRSATTFKETFGETPIGLVGVNLIAMVVALPVLAPGAYLLFAEEILILGLPLFVAGVLIAQLITYTLRGIVKTALYFYATEGNRPAEFDEVFDRLDDVETSRSTGPRGDGFI